VFRWDLCAQDPAGTPNPSRVDEHECAGIRREKSSIADSRRLASGHRGAIVSLGFTSDSALLVTGGDDQTVRVWNLADPDLASPEVLRGHDGPITAVAISPDHRWIFSGSEDHSVRQWNLGASESSGLQRAAASTPELLGIHEGGEVYAVAISFDGRFIATGAEGGGTCLWQRSQDGPSERVVLQDCSVGGKPGSRTDNPPPPPAPATRSIAISPDSRWLVSGGEGVNARIWDLTAQPFRPREIGGPIGALAISRNSHWLAMGGDGVVVHLLDLTKPPQAGQTLLRPAPAGGEAEAREPELDRAGARPAITAIAISADNHWLAAGDYFGRVYLWDLNTPGEGARQPVLYRHQGPITAMAISPDGRWLVTASKDHPMVVRWDLARVDAGGAPQDLSGHTKGGVRSMAFSSDGRWLVTGGEDKTARLWDLGSLLGNPHSVALRHGETVSVVAISSQEPRVITGSYDKTVRLWDLTAADPSANPVVLNHNEGINAIAASADGRFLVTGTSYDFKATLFMLRTEDLVQLARDIAGRDLTGSERQASSLE
jgi:WD40 repeat protein